MSLGIGLFCILVSPVTEWILQKALLKNLLEQGVGPGIEPTTHKPRAMTPITVLRLPKISKVSPESQTISYIHHKEWVFVCRRF